MTWRLAKDDAAETQVLRETGMYAPLTRHRRRYVEERCWKDERGFRCARPENLIGRTQNCGSLADCWHNLDNLEEEYPLIETWASRYRQTATSSPLLVYFFAHFECAYLSLLPLTCGFDTIATLDYICFEGYRPRRTMKLEEEATCIAEDGSHLVASPERCCRRSTVLAYWL